VVAAQLGASTRWRVSDADASERQRVAKLLESGLDLSAARILLLGKVQVPPQQRAMWQRVLWLEHCKGPAAIWEPLPLGLVLVVAQEAKVCGHDSVKRQRQSFNGMSCNDKLC
jgi:hypothetical protein